MSVGPLPPMEASVAIPIAYEAERALVVAGASNHQAYAVLAEAVELVYVAQWRGLAHRLLALGPRFEVAEHWAPDGSLSHWPAALDARDRATLADHEHEAIPSAVFARRCVEELRRFARRREAMRLAEQLHRSGGEDAEALRELVALAGAVS